MQKCFEKGTPLDVSGVPFGAHFCSKCHVFSERFSSIDVERAFYMFPSFFEPLDPQKTLYFCSKTRVSARSAYLAQCRKISDFTPFQKSIFDNFGILFHYFFGVDFFMIFGCRFGSLLAPKRKIRSVTFSDKNLVFSRSRFRAGIFVNFDEFWMEFRWILMDFSIIVGPFSHKFCKVLDVVCIHMFDAFSHPWRINFA